MPSVFCPNCSKSFNAPIDTLGRKAKCSRCRKSFVIEFLKETESYPGIELAQEPVPHPQFESETIPNFEELDESVDGNGDTETLHDFEPPPTVKRIPTPAPPESATVPVVVNIPSVSETIDPLAAAAFGIALSLWLDMSPLLSPIAVATSLALFCAALTRLRMRPLRRPAIFTAILLVVTGAMLGAHVVERIETQHQRNAERQDAE